MTAIPYSRFRRNPGKVIDDVIDSDKSVTITRADGREVVLVSAREFASWKETRHLLSRPKNARRLRASVSEIEARIAARKS